MGIFRAFSGCVQVCVCVMGGAGQGGAVRGWAERGIVTTFSGALDGYF